MAPPSTTTSRPQYHSLQPVVRSTCGLARKLTVFCSSAPVEKWRAPSSHTATSGLMCGRPSARAVVIQNSSAASSVRTVSSHEVGAVPGSLKRSSSVVVGSLIESPFCLRRGASGLRQFVLDQSIDPFAGCEVGRDAVAHHGDGDAGVDVGV